MKSKMTKEEKRDFLKPFRCVGGFIIFTTTFLELFNMFLFVVLFFTDAIFGQGIISNNIAELLMYGAIVYTYYIGYRIFFKKYLHNFCDLKDISKNKRNKAIFGMIISFILVRFCWIVWTYFLDAVGYNHVIETDLQQVYLFGTIYATMIAPIFEEIVFRGWILNILKKYGTIPAIVISSLTFGIFHGTVYQSVPTIFIGIILAILAIKYKSIIPSIIVHLTSNLLSVILEYLPKTNYLLLFQRTFTILFIIFSIITMVYLIIINLNKISNCAKKTLKSFVLLYHSISYMLFLLLYITIIVIDFIDGIHILD